MRAAVIGAYPDLAGAPVQMLTHSWDSIALDLGDILVCKFPQGERAKAALAYEARILALLQGRLRLAVPAMVLHPGPPLFSAHAKLPGGHLTAEVYETLSEAERDSVGQALGRFYADLHAVPADLAKAAGAGAIGPWTAGPVVAGALPLLPSSLRPIAGQVLDAWDTLPPDPLGMVFGFFDGHGWNMAFDAATRCLNGVYDFADSGFGPLHQDFVYSNFIAADLTDRIVATYRRETGRAVDMTRIDLSTSVFRLSELADAAPGDDPGHLDQMLRNACVWLSTGRTGLTHG